MQERMAAANQAGLTLHRSELVAHTFALLERKGVGNRASARAKGRFEGFASNPNYPFKPLGAPLHMERVAHLNSSKVIKVKLMAETIMQSVTQKPKKGDAAAVEGHAGHDGDRGAADEKGGRSLEAERQQQERAQEQPDSDEPRQFSPKPPVMPYGLGKDLPRCTARRHLVDGFLHLRKYVRESHVRVQQVKTDAAASETMFKQQEKVLSLEGLPVGEQAVEVDHLLPVQEAPGDRSRPQSTMSGSVVDDSGNGSMAEGGGDEEAAPVTARKRPSQAEAPRRSLLAARRSIAGHAHRANRSGDATAHMLAMVPTLSTGGERKDRGGKAELLKETIRNLLGFSERPRMSDQDDAVKGKKDIRRYLDGKFDKCWKSKSLLRSCMSSFEKEDDRQRLIRVHRILEEEHQKNLLQGIEDDVEFDGMSTKILVEYFRAGLEQSQGAAFVDETGTGTVPNGTALTGPGNTATSSAVADSGHEAAAERTRKREQTEDVDTVAKAMKQLKDQVAAVNRLRDAVKEYQTSREEKKTEMEEKILEMNANKPASILQRLGIGPESAQESPRIRALPPIANSDRLVEALKALSPGPTSGLASPTFMT